MPVTKSTNRHCSSAFVQKTRNSNASSSATVNPPQTSWIPRQPGPGNPSWLSTYNITIPEETEPVLSVDNPDDSGIAGAGPASVSDEPGFPDSRAAKVPAIKKKKKKKSGKKSGKSQETAITTTEETRLVLSIANQNDFKIEKTRPVPIPDEFLHFKRNLDDISTLYKGDNFAEAKKKATIIVKILEGKPEAENLIRYLNSVIFLCHVMQDMTFCHDLPANNSAEFIHWMITIAEAARQESDDLPASSKLMLFCLRWAADAGDQGARQYLVKVLLFRQLCPDMPSPDVHFFPAEALDHLANMARDDTQLPIPENDQEKVINRMVELIKLRNTANHDSSKKELIDFLRNHSHPEIQLLIPLIYTSEVFGPPEYNKAREYLEPFPVPDAKESVSSSVNDVCQFWQLMCDTNPHTHHEASTVEALHQLAQKGFLAAIHLLSELSRMRENISLSCVSAFIRSPGPGFPEYPHLTHSLCKFYSEKTGPQGSANEQGILGQDEEMSGNVRNFLLNAGIQGDPGIRDHVIWCGFQKIFNEENLRKAGREFVPPLPEALIRILHNSQYTQDPAALIYIHCAQVLRHGKADKKLIEMAERKDVLSTCFHMLMMSDATEEMDDAVLANKLLDIPHVKDQDFLAWIDHPGFADFIKNLRLCAPLCRESESCNLLCLDLLDLAGRRGKGDEDRVEVLDALALGKLRQGNIEEANWYYEQSWKLKDAPSVPGAERRYVNTRSYRIVRSDLPEYYYHLLSVNVRSSHPMETRCRFDRLLSVWKNMQENKDPSLWHAWATTAVSFITYSYWHITPEMCQTLTDNTALAITKQHNLSLALILATNEELACVKGNIAKKHKIEGIPDFPELTTDDCALTEATSKQYSPCLETGSPDEMARLPSMVSANFYTVQHHILAEVQKAESMDDIIRHMKKVTMEHDFDPATFIRLLTPRFDSEWLLPKHVNDVFDILSLLQKKLNKYYHAFPKQTINLKCKLMLTMHMYCRRFIGNADQALENIMERMDQQRTALTIKHPEDVMKNIYNLSNNITGEKEHDALCLVMITSKSSKKFNELLIHIIRSYHPRVALKLFNTFFTTKDECLSKLEQLKTSHSDFKHILELIGYQVKGQKKEVSSFLKGNIRKKTLSAEQKIQLLWYACESPLITDKTSIEQMATLINNIPQHIFIKILIGDIRNNEHLKKMVSSEKVLLLQHHHQMELGFRLLSINRTQAADMWVMSESTYPLAMLAWHHNILPGKEVSFDVRQALLHAAKNGEIKAQCELIRWLLEQQRDGKETSTELKRQACRFVHLPHPMAGAESLLYQGITQHLGFGCEPDLITGKQKIQEALDRDPLIVALRLYDLKQQGLFALPEDLADYLLCYARALSERNKDPFNRRDNYFNNLFLSYGSDTLQELLVSLRDRAGSGLSPSDKPVYQQATNRLGEWLGQCQGVRPPRQVHHEEHPE